MSIRDTDEFRRGRAFEDALGAWFERGGAYVAPVYDPEVRDGYSRAPAFQGANDRIVLPDLQVMAGGKMFWAEAKLKKKAPAFHIMDELQTMGCELRLVEHYRRIAIESGCPVYIYFGVRKENEVRMVNAHTSELDGMRGTEKYSNDGGPMAMWAWKTLAVACTLDEVRAAHRGRLAPRDALFHWDTEAQLDMWGTEAS